MKAVILAAGKGTRMGELTRDAPKAMIPVGGRPVIEQVIRQLWSAGFGEFVVLTRYLAERIEDHMGDGDSFGVHIAYVRQPERPYGTGAALLATEAAVGDSSLLMTYGDILTPGANYAGAVAVFEDAGADAVITLNRVQDPCLGGAVQVGEDGRVTGIIEKPPTGVVPWHWNSSGILVFRPIVFDYLRRIRESPRGEYELPDAVNMMADDGLRILPYYLQGPWIDVGRPQDIAAAERMLRQESFRGGGHS